MTEQELKRLSRSDLLEMMLTLAKENEQLRQQLNQANEHLSNRTITIDNAGSLAEAAMQLNGIFEAAQATCDQYIQNIKLRSEQQEKLCAQLEQETQDKCARLIADAQKEADRYINEATQKIQQMVNSHDWLSSAFQDLKNNTQ